MPKFTYNKNIVGYEYIYIYIERERERERERWVQIIPGVTSQELHLLWTIDYY